MMTTTSSSPLGIISCGRDAEVSTSSSSISIGSGVPPRVETEV